MTVGNSALFGELSHLSDGGREVVYTVHVAAGDSQTLLGGLGRDEGSAVSGLAETDALLGCGVTSVDSRLFALQYAVSRQRCLDGKLGTGFAYLLQIHPLAGCTLLQNARLVGIEIGWQHVQVAISR